MPCCAKPQFRRGRLSRCVRCLTLLRDAGSRASADLWHELLEVEPELDASVARNTLNHLERRGYVEGQTYHLPTVPSGRRRCWSLSELGRAVLDRYERLLAVEVRLAA